MQLNHCLTHALMQGHIDASTAICGQKLATITGTNTIPLTYSFITVLPSYHQVEYNQVCPMAHWGHRTVIAATHAMQPQALTSKDIKHLALNQRCSATPAP